MSTERLNWMSWDGLATRRVEVWQLSFVDRLSRVGYLIEYGLGVPQAGGPIGRIRFARFDADNPRRSLAMTRQVALQGKVEQTGGRPWRISIGDATFGHDALKGEIVSDHHVARWDLGFDVALQPHVYLPPITHARPLTPPGTLQVVAPNPTTHVTGRIEVDGATAVIEDEPGCQLHRWGERHPARWALAYCNAFREDATAALQLFSWRPADDLLRGALPLITSVAVYLGGEVYDFTTFPRVMLSRCRWETELLRFSASGKRVKIEGELRARPEDFCRAELGDPTTGGAANRHVTEVADAVVTVWARRSRLGRFRQLCRLTSRSAAHFEHGAPTPDARVERSYEQARTPR